MSSARRAGIVLWLSFAVACGRPPQVAATGLETSNGTAEESLEATDSQLGDSTDASSSSDESSDGAEDATTGEADTGWPEGEAWPWGPVETCMYPADVFPLSIAGSHSLCTIACSDSADCQVEGSAAELFCTFTSFSTATGCVAPCDADSDCSDLHTCIFVSDTAGICGETNP